MINTSTDPKTVMPPRKITLNFPLSNLLHKIDTMCMQCSESTDTQSLLADSLHTILEILKVKRGAVFVRDQQTNKLVLKAAIGMTAEEHLLPGSFISSPLMIKGEKIGNVNISDKISQKPFTKRETQLLNFLSNQIAVNYQRISISEESIDLKRQMVAQERLVSLGKLAGGIAHDFNNPLDGVMRYTKLCLTHAQNDEVLREYLLEIQTGLKRMANIVKNLLACARQSPDSVYTVDIQKPIERALKELYPYLVSKNINLVKNYADNVPEITDWGIERIISNLLKNAIDAIDATEKNGTIEIETQVEDGFIKIKVADTGRGIQPEHVDKIFEPFFTTKEIDQGCGLGLTVVDEVIKCYNGQIKVKSKLGAGTTFTVKIPLTRKS